METTKERSQEAAAGKASNSRTFSRGNMKKDDPSPRKLLAISCPTCGAAPGKNVILPAANRALNRIEFVDYSQKARTLMNPRFADCL